jgi:hypothetical protein
MTSRNVDLKNHQPILVCPSTHNHIWIINRHCKIDWKFKIMITSVDQEEVLPIGRMQTKTLVVISYNVIFFVTEDNNYEQNQYGRMKTS